MLPLWDLRDYVIPLGHSWLHVPFAVGSMSLLIFVGHQSPLHQDVNLHLFNESRFDNIKGLELEYENLALQIFVSLPCVINTSVGYCVLGKCCYVASNNSVI